MSSLLLDTHTFLWSLSAHEKLSSKVCDFQAIDFGHKRQRVCGLRGIWVAYGVVSGGNLTLAVGASGVECDGGEWAVIR